MPTLLTLGTAHRPDGTVVLTALGEIDLSNVDDFDHALVEVRETAPGEALTVDLSAVEYLDSAAIHVLVERGQDVHLIAHPLLMPTLALSGLTEVMSVEAAPGDAST